jgi:hypothetical protein
MLAPKLIGFHCPNKQYLSVETSVNRLVQYIERLLIFPLNQPVTILSQYSVDLNNSGIASIKNISSGETIRNLSLIGKPVLFHNESTALFIFN